MFKCTSSQWSIKIAPKSLAHQYDVEMIFGPPDTIDEEGARGVQHLTKSNDPYHKKLCRHILNGAEFLEEITYVYDERSIMLTNKPLKQDIHLVYAQPDLDDKLRESLTDPQFILKIVIQKVKVIDLSQFSTSVVPNGAEDRTWRTAVELILSAHPITRKDSPYVALGSGELYEARHHPFQRGLVERNGNRKGVQVITDSDGKPQLCLALDFCKKVFFPGGIRFIDLVQNFMGNGQNYHEAEAIFKKLKLCPIYNRTRILHFKKFTDVNVRALMANGDTSLEAYCREAFHHTIQYPNERAANMTNGHGDFPLELLEVLPNQSVPILRMIDNLKEKALELNRLKPYQRFAEIQRQFNNLKLNNPITAAFGLEICPKMLEGSFSRSSMNILLGSGATVRSNDQGSFKYDRNRYYKPSGFTKFVVLANRRDQRSAVECANALVEVAAAKGMQLPAPVFQEFDTYSKRLNIWTQALEAHKKAKPLVLVIDGNQESHPVVKLAETLAGVQTQHMFAKTAYNIARRTPVLENIVHKLNIKAGGLNHVADFAGNMKSINMKESLILAFDVSHPTGDDYRGSTDEPSVGALVGNYLENPHEFAGIFFFQKPRQEAIDQTPLQIYVKKMLQHVRKYRTIKTIIFLRDAVSEGQYEDVLHGEIPAIAISASELDIKAKMLGILVTKDGNVRHFNASPNGQASMPPCSFVEFGTRHGYHQFYMTAHRAFAGTAKSVMITVLRDDLGIPLAEIRAFMLGLTYMHQIIAAPVSIPAPLYQAHVLGGRGQKLFRAMKKYDPRRIPDAIDYLQLSDLLNFNGTNLPMTRYTA